jgi:hypothetical protein
MPINQDVKPIIKRSIKEILNSSTNLTDEVREWAIDQVSQGKSDVLARTSSSLTWSIYGPLSASHGGLKDVYANDLIDVLKTVYGPGGPLETQQFSVLPKVVDSPDLIGALYFLANSDFNGVSVKTRKRAIKIVAEIALEAQDKWGRVLAVLQKIDQTIPGHGLVDSIPERLGSFHSHMGYAIDVVTLQKAGGVERLKEVGADLKKVFDAALSQMGKASLYPGSWSFGHAFFKEALEDLKASGRVTNSDLHTAYGSVLRGFLDSLESKGGRKSLVKYDGLKPIFSDLVPFVSPETASSLAINLFRCNGLEWVGAYRESMVSMIDPDSFKNGLKSFIDSGEQYNLVASLGVEHIFTRLELYSLKGEKLDTALGL